MKGNKKSRLLDSDMQGVLPALLRAAKRAREIARQTGTSIVIMRDGELIEEWVGPEEEEEDSRGDRE